MGWNDEGTSGTKGRLGDCRFDNYLRSGASGRFYDAIHEFGNFSVVSEAGEAAAKFVFVFESPQFGCLDLHGNSVSVF